MALWPRTIICGALSDLYHVRVPVTVPAGGVARRGRADATEAVALDSFAALYRLPKCPQTEDDVCRTCGDCWWPGHRWPGITVSRTAAGGPKGGRGRLAAPALGTGGRGVDVDDHVRVDPVITVVPGRRARAGLPARPCSPGRSPGRRAAGPLTALCYLRASCTAPMPGHRSCHCRLRPPCRCRSPAGCSGWDNFMAQRSRSWPSLHPRTSMPSGRPRAGNAACRSRSDNDPALCCTSSRPFQCYFPAGGLSGRPCRRRHAMNQPRGIGGDPRPARPQRTVAEDGPAPLSSVSRSDRVPLLAWVIARDIRGGRARGERPVRLPAGRAVLHRRGAPSRVRLRRPATAGPAADPDHRHTRRQPDGHQDHPGAGGRVHRDHGGQVRRAVRRGPARPGARRPHHGVRSRRHRRRCTSATPRRLTCSPGQQSCCASARRCCGPGRAGGLRAGAAAGAGLEADNLMVLLLIGLAVGILASAHRPVLWTRWPWLGAGIAAVIWAPNVIWQATHGWPQLAMSAALHRENTSSADYASGVPAQLALPGTAGGAAGHRRLLRALADPRAAVHRRRRHAHPDLRAGLGTGQGVLRRRNRAGRAGSGRAGGRTLDRPCSRPPRCAALAGGSRDARGHGSGPAESAADPAGQRRAHACLHLLSTAQSETPSAGRSSPARSRRRTRPWCGPASRPPRYSPGTTPEAATLDRLWRSATTCRRCSPATTPIGCGDRAGLRPHGARGRRAQPTAAILRQLPAADHLQRRPTMCKTTGPIFRSASAPARYPTGARCGRA